MAVNSSLALGNTTLSGDISESSMLRGSLVSKPVREMIGSVLKSSAVRRSRPQTHHQTLPEFV